MQVEIEWYAQPDGHSQQDGALPDMPDRKGAGHEPDGRQKIEGDQQPPAQVARVQHKLRQRAAAPEDVGQPPQGRQARDDFGRLWAGENPIHLDRLPVPLHRDRHNITWLYALVELLAQVAGVSLPGYRPHLQQQVALLQASLVGLLDIDPCDLARTRIEIEASVGGHHKAGIGQRQQHCQYQPGQAGFGQAAQVRP